jgi:hypothetical protein
MTRIKRLQELTLISLGFVLLASLLAIPAIADPSTFAWVLSGHL